MTAEIALMNKEAIALAADSAVTMSTGSIPKIDESIKNGFELLPLSQTQKDQLRL